MLAFLALIAAIRSHSLAPQVEWLVFMAMAYVGLGWLFGSYTVLCWRRPSLGALIQRVLITGLATFVLVAMVRFLANPPEEVWLVHRSVQVQWLLALTTWSLLVRWLLRRGRSGSSGDK